MKVIDKESRLGETNTNTYGSKMVIEDYISYKNVLVKFLDSNYLKFTDYDRFKKGKVKNPYDKSIYGIGYIGEGRYKTTENGKPTPQYTVWRNMLQRCHDKNQNRKYPTYEDVTVIQEWRNFQAFAEWYNHNYYEVDNQRMELDKDILIKGNKLYSPETCIFVPHDINMLFIKRDSKRGEYPIGVSFDKRKKKFEAACSNIDHKQKRIGRYTTMEDAFNAYKIYKENLIKQVANQYKDKIPVGLYNTLITYEVEITD